MNTIILSGNLCKDIELKYTSSNKPVLQNTIAVRNDYKNANGDYDSQFINIVVWNKAAEYLKQYAAKGSKVLVEGRLQNRSYEKQDGSKAYITEVVVEKVELLGSPVKSGQPEQKPDKPDYTAKGLANDVFADFGSSIEINDDDVAF